MIGDRDKWNRRHGAASAAVPPSPLVTELAAELPVRGRALDVAGGAGRHALWLARRGLAVTLVDVSDVALAQAAREDPRPGTLTTLACDLDVEPLPAGPWDVVVVFHFLQRALFGALAQALAPGGLLLYVQPTVRNLERHARPGAQFLLAEGELRRAFEGKLDVVRYDEGWLAEGRHEARLLARATSRAPG